ncbi:MAG: hypothetical protein WC379_03910 [Methanoregula sp.]|jgi:hypothetical protein
MESFGPELFAFLVVFFGMGIWAIFSGYRDYRLMEKVNNTPTSRVSSAALGLVELAGHAGCHEGLTSPVSRIRCAYWRITGEYSDENGCWQRIFLDESTDHFHIRDNTGSMEVDPRGAEMDIPVNRTWEGFIQEHRGSFIPESGGLMLPEPAMKFVQSFKETKTKKIHDHADQKIRITEYIIAENDPLYVLGSAMPRDDRTGPVNHENLIIRKGTYDSSLYISNTTKKVVRDKFFSWAYPKIILGLACSAICLFGILMMLETAGDIIVLIGITAAALIGPVIWHKWKGHM